MRFIIVSLHNNIEKIQTLLTSVHNKMKLLINLHYEKL